MRSELFRITLYPFAAMVPERAQRVRSFLLSERYNPSRLISVSVGL